MIFEPHEPSCFGGDGEPKKSFVQCWEAFVGLWLWLWIGLEGWWAGGLVGWWVGDLVSNSQTLQCSIMCVVGVCVVCSV